MPPQADRIIAVKQAREALFIIISIKIKNHIPNEFLIQTLVNSKTTNTVLRLFALVLLKLSPKRPDAAFESLDSSKPPSRTTSPKPATRDVERSRFKSVGLLMVLVVVVAKLETV